MNPDPNGLASRTDAPVSQWLHRRVRLCVWGLAIAGLAGCQTLDPRGPKPEPTSPPAMPAKFLHDRTTGDAAASAQTAQPAATDPAAVPDNEWWRRFGNAELDALVARALRANPDLKVAALKIDQARIRADQAKAGTLPSITAPLRFGASSTGGVTDAQRVSQASLAGTWRADVWGEQRGLVESAQLQTDRSVHELENIQRITISNLVSAYVSYLGANDALALAMRTETIDRQLLDTQERKLALGDSGAEEVEIRRAVFLAQQSNLQALTRQRDLHAITIARLVGTVPGDLSLGGIGLRDLNLPPSRTALPTSLLLRRPDIRMMEARLRAASADIEVARARLMPPLDLGAQAGLSAVSMAKMLQPQAFVMSALASLAVTVFDGGRRAGDEAIARSVQQEMLETYGQTVLQAIRDVEMALLTVNTTRLQLDAQQLMIRSATTRLGFASQAFAAGSIDMVGLLDVRKSYHQALNEEFRLTAELLAAHAGLAFALGDGPTGRTQPGLVSRR